MKGVVIAIVMMLAATAHASSLSDSYALHARGDLAGAVRAMKTAVDAEPRSYFLRVRLAYLELLAGDYTGAADSYSRAVDMNPDALEPWLGKQQALLALNRYDESERAGREALGLDGKNYLASSRLAWALLQQKRFVDAAEIYAAVVLLYPGDVDMRLGLGEALAGAHQCAQATQAFEDVLAMVPGHKLAQQGIASCR